MMILKDNQLHVFILPNTGFLKKNPSFLFLNFLLYEEIVTLN